MTKLNRIRLSWPVQIVLALICVAGAWYFGLHVALTGLTAMDRQIRPNSDLVPAWFGSREILFHRGDPYSAKVTSDIQNQIYGAQVGAEVDQQQFAYPAFSAFLFLPFAVLPFWAAEKLAFVVFVAFTAASVYWWVGKPTPRYWMVATLLVFASFPFFYALHGRQPTLLIAGILAASYAAARSGRLTLCGVLLALTTAKPQLAIAVALPIAAWVLGDLRQRKAVAISFACSAGILLIASLIFSPHWIIPWLRVLRTYGQYVAAKPLVSLSLGPLLGDIAACAILLSVIYVLWKWREDLPFTVAYCVAAFALVIRFHFYDEVLLLAPLTWLALNSVKLLRWTSRILFASVAVSLVMGWFFMIAISLLYVVSERVALILWEFPLGLAGSLPFLIFFALWHQAFIVKSRVFIRFTL